MGNPKHRRWGIAPRPENIRQAKAPDRANIGREIAFATAIWRRQVAGKPKGRSVCPALNGGKRLEAGGFWVDIPEAFSAAEPAGFLGFYRCASLRDARATGPVWAPMRGIRAGSDPQALWSWALLATRGGSLEALPHGRATEGHCGACYSERSWASNCRSRE
jgi:hypothetical protein